MPSQYLDRPLNKRTFPICGDFIRRLSEALPGLVFSPTVKQWLGEIWKHQQEALRIAGLADADGDARLRPWQRTGALWLRHVRRGVLADEQGAGKTVTALSALAGVQEPGRVVIVCPGATRDNWVEHVREWTGRHCVVVEGDRRRRLEAISSWSDVLVISCSGLRLHYDDLNDVGVLILDEAHVLRNRETDTFNAARQVARHAEYVWMLTATPTVNSAVDLWPLLHLCDPWRWSSYWDFVFRFMLYEEDDFGIRIEGVKETETGALEQVLLPYVLKRDHVSLPGELREHVWEFVLPPDMREMYAYTENWCDFQWSPLSSITFLRQAAIDPRLMYRNYDGSSKLDELPKILEEFGNPQALFFTMFARVATRIADVLPRTGRICGEDSEEQRRDTIDAFRRGEIRHLALTYGVGGEGLNLTEATLAVLVDPPWHPAGIQHATRRIYRIGQTRDCDVVRVFSPDTVEGLILGIISKKRRVTIRELAERLGVAIGGGEFGLFW